MKTSQVLVASIAAFGLLTVGAGAGAYLGWTRPRYEHGQVLRRSITLLPPNQWGRTGGIIACGTCSSTGRFYYVLEVSETVCPVNALDRSLLSAIRQGHARMVRVLLRQGANPNAQDGSGEYALCLAAQAPVLGQMTGMTVSGQGQTVTMRRGYDEMVVALLEHGARVGVKDSWGRTPLHQAQECGGSKAITALLAAGAARQ